MQRRSRRIKLVSIATIAAIVAMAFSAAAIGAVSNYRVVAGQGCWLPDATLTAKQLVNAAPSIVQTAGGQWRASCSGRLPSGARLPASTMTYSYASTGRLCVAQLGDQYMSSTSYSGTISPTGVVKINCLLN